MITREDFKKLELDLKYLKEIQPENSRYFQYGYIIGLDGAFENQGNIVSSDQDYSSFHVLFNDELALSDNLETKTELRDVITGKPISKFSYRKSIYGNKLKFTLENLINFVREEHNKFLEQVKEEKQLLK